MWVSGGVSRQGVQGWVSDDVRWGIQQMYSHTMVMHVRIKDCPFGMTPSTEKETHVVRCIHDMFIQPTKVINVGSRVGCPGVSSWVSEFFRWVDKWNAAVAICGSRGGCPGNEGGSRRSSGRSGGWNTHGSHRQPFLIQVCSSHAHYEWFICHNMR